MTFWEKIFLKRDVILPSGKQTYLIGDPEIRRSQKFEFSNGLPYFSGKIGGGASKKNQTENWIEAKKEFVREFDERNLNVTDEMPVHRRAGSGPPFKPIKTPIPTKKVVKHNQNHSFTGTENYAGTWAQT